TVLCDRSRVLQIFVNLFKNAVEHGQATRVEVSTETDQKFLSVLVSNNGRTIPEDMKKNLFRFRVSSKKHGGRGLLIVRRLAEAHDWHVDLLPAGRTTFRIRIPRRMVVSWR
ncbi:MAG: sensor histidine kinase, partial [Candidatus Thorarchaeota archaeon]